MPPWVKRRSTLTTIPRAISHGSQLNRYSSEELAILDEAGAVRQRVVKAARNGIGLVREPMDAARAGRARGLVYCLNQRAAQPELARALGHEQVLQIAVVADRPAGAVIDVMHDAEKLAIDVAAEQPHRLVWIVQPRPGRVVGLLRRRDPVEIEIALPQRLPGHALVQAQRADRNLRGHGNAAISAWMRSSCGMVSAGCGSVSQEPRPSTNTTGGRLLISIRAANASSVTHAGGAMCGSSMLSSFVVSQRTEARKHEAPAAAGRGLRDLIAD